MDRRHTKKPEKARRQKSARRSASSHEYSSSEVNEEGRTNDSGRRYQSLSRLEQKGLQWQQERSEINEEWNPWGRPGAGASNQPGPSYSQDALPQRKTFPKIRFNSDSIAQGFGAIDPRSFQEEEAKKMRALEIQRENARLLEEKRQEKREEKERLAREEAERDRKLKLEREQMRMEYERDLRRQKEKEDEKEKNRLLVINAIKEAEANAEADKKKRNTCAEKEKFAKTSEAKLSTKPKQVIRQKNVVQSSKQNDSGTRTRGQNNRYEQQQKHCSTVKKTSETGRKNLQMDFETESETAGTEEEEIEVEERLESSVSTGAFKKLEMKQQALKDREAYIENIKLERVRLEIELENYKLQIKELELERQRQMISEPRCLSEREFSRNTMEGHRSGFMNYCSPHRSQMGPLPRGEEFTFPNVNQEVNIPTHCRHCHTRENSNVNNLERRSCFGSHDQRSASTSRISNSNENTQRNEKDHTFTAQVSSNEKVDNFENPTFSSNVAKSQEQKDFEQRRLLTTQSMQRNQSPAERSQINKDRKISNLNEDVPSEEQTSTCPRQTTSPPVPALHKKMEMIQGDTGNSQIESQSSNYVAHWERKAPILNDPAGRLASNAERPPSSAGRPPSNAIRLASDAERPPSGAGRPPSGVGRLPRGAGKQARNPVRLVKGAGRLACNARLARGTGSLAGNGGRLSRSDGRLDKSAGRLARSHMSTAQVSANEKVDTFENPTNVSKVQGPNDIEKSGQFETQAMNPNPSFAEGGVSRNINSPQRTQQTIIDTNANALIEIARNNEISECDDDNAHQSSEEKMKLPNNSTNLNYREPSSDQTIVENGKPMLQDPLSSSPPVPALQKRLAKVEKEDDGKKEMLDESEMPHCEGKTKYIAASIDDENNQDVKVTDNQSHNYQQSCENNVLISNDAESPMPDPENKKETGNHGHVSNILSNLNEKVPSDKQTRTFPRQIKSPPVPAFMQGHGVDPQDPHYVAHWERKAPILYDPAGRLARGAERLARGAGGQTRGAGRLASNAGRQASGDGRLARGAGRQASGDGRLATGAGRLARGARGQASGDGRLAKGARRQSSGAGRQARSAQRDPLLAPARQPGEPSPRQEQILEDLRARQQEEERAQKARNPKQFGR